MTADGSAAELPARDRAARGSPLGHGPDPGARSGVLPLEVTLGLCDKLLGEVGRRRHLFSWLRAPGSQSDSWLPVEAYYPGHRLVVVCRAERTQHDHLFDDFVPRHGLRLLALEPGQLGDDPKAAEHLLALEIAALPPLASQADPEPDRILARRLTSISLPSLVALAPRGRSVGSAETAGSTAAGDSERAGGSARRDTGRAGRTGVANSRARASAPAWGDRPALGIMAGMALAVVCCAEVYLAVFAAGASGRVVLAVGIALDAFARALGTIAESRAANESWAWACALVGSPAVAVFTLLRRSDPVPVEAAPLAGPISVLAMLAVAAGLLV